MTAGPPNPQTGFIGGKDPRSPKGRWTREELWYRARVPLLLLLLAALGGVSLYLYSGKGRATRQATAAPNDSRVSEEQAEKLRLRSLELEAAFEKVRLERFDLKEEDIVLLERALQAQEDYIVARQSVGTENQRFILLRRRLHLLRSERLRYESTQAEEKALATAKGDPTAAQDLLRKALACEEEIAAKWDAAGLADPGRRARLDTRLRRLESEPLWNRGRTAEAEGEKLLAAGQFEAAAQKFSEAVQCETEFLGKYRDVRDTEFGRADKLTLKQETALSGQSWEKVAELRDQAQKLEKAGDWSAAGKAWQVAIETFNQLLADFPRSTLANRDLDAQMVTRQNYARFHEEIIRTHEGLSKIRGELRQRQVSPALARVGTMLEAARSLAAANTGAFLPADSERQELEYLAANEAVVRNLLPRMEQNLRPIPGANARMYRTEIPQGLYASVVGANPSAARREAGPVESVSYADAQDFCAKLGWITGQTVRLPTVEEFTAATGDLKQAPGAALAWTAANTDGVNPRPVATTTANLAGFHDLLGNVEEWVQAPLAAESAPAYGGSIATAGASGVMVRNLLKREKMRTLGFRIVIE